MLIILFALLIVLSSFSLAYGDQSGSTADTHTLTLSTDGHGTAVFQNNSTSVTAAPGERIVITMTPDAGYQPSAVTCKLQNSGPITYPASYFETVNDAYTLWFIMGERDGTVSVEFALADYAVNQGAITGSGSIQTYDTYYNTNTHKAGETAYFTVFPGTDYGLVSLNVKCNGQNVDFSRYSPESNSMIFCFTMPAGDARIDAAFAPLRTYILEELSPSEPDMFVNITSWDINVGETQPEPDGGTTNYIITAAEGAPITMNIDWMDPALVNNYSATYQFSFTPGEHVVQPLESNDEAMPISFTLTDTAAPTEYTVTLAECENGGIRLAGETATFTVGDTVYLIVKPDEGYEVDSQFNRLSFDLSGISTEYLGVKVSDGKSLYHVDWNYDENPNSYSFTMPEDNVTVTASFRRVYTVAVSSQMTNGSFSLDRQRAVQGEAVTVSQITPAPGYDFDSLSIQYEANGTPVTQPVEIVDGDDWATFTMPAADVTVLAGFTLHAYPLSIVPPENGTLNADKEFLSLGDTVTFNANSNPGYSLASLWLTPMNQYINVNDNSLQYTLIAEDVAPYGSISNIEANATFTAIPYNYSVTQPETGGTISAFCNESSTEGTATVGQVVSLTATPVDDYVLDHFVVAYTDANGQEHTEELTGMDAQFSMPASDVSIQAVFRQKTYSVYTSTDGHGEISAEPYSFTAGEKVSLDILPYEHYQLSTLTATYTDDNGDPVAVTISDNSFTMPAADVTVTATFVPDATMPYSIRCEYNSSAGYLSVRNGRYRVVAGTQVILSPSVNSGYRLTGISLSYTDPATGESVTVPVSNRQFVMPAADVTVTATYDRVSNAIYLITLNGPYGSQTSPGSFFVYTDDGYIGGGGFDSTYDDPYTWTAEVSIPTNATYIAFETFTSSGGNPDDPAGMDTILNTDKVYLNWNGNTLQTASFSLLGLSGTIEKKATGEFLIATSASEFATITADKSTAEQGEVVTVTVTPNGTGRFNRVYLEDASGNEIYDYTGMARNEDGTWSFWMPGCAVTVVANFARLYSITLPESTVGGSVSVNYRDGACENDQIIVTAMPFDGFRLDRLYYTDANGNQSVDISNGSFEMPAFDIHIYAIFAYASGGTQGDGHSKHSILINGVEGGTITAWVDEVEVSEAAMGKTVILNVEPNTGYRVETVICNGETIVLDDDDTYSFSMPDEDVTVSATFVSESSTTAVVTFNANGGSPTPDNQTVSLGSMVTQPDNPTLEGYSFLGWFAENANAPFDFANSPIYGDITLTAQWMIATHVHELVHHEEKAPTCTLAGTEEYWECSVCNKLFSDEECTTEIETPVVIPAAGHTTTATVARTATCTEAGNSAYWTCATCGKHFSDAAGEAEIDEDSWIFPATGHTMIATSAKQATCTEAGNNAYWTCETCGKHFSDADGETETGENSWIIPAIGHAWRPATYVWAEDSGTERA